MKRKYSHVESLNESLWTIPDDYFKGSIFPKDYFKPFLMLRIGNSYRILIRKAVFLHQLS